MKLISSVSLEQLLFYLDYLLNQLCFLQPFKYLLKVPNSDKVKILYLNSIKFI